MFIASVKITKKKKLRQKSEEIYMRKKVAMQS